MIKIDDNYSIEPDAYGWRLVYSEPRTPPSGISYIFQDSFYFAELKDCLKKYCDLKLKEATSLEHVIDLIAQLHKKVEELCPKIFVVGGELKILKVV